MAKDAYYFKHDSNAKDDPKCVFLIESLGPEGYGIFWILVETLRDQPEYRYPLALIPAIARKYNTTLDKVKAVVTKFNLFTLSDDSFFFSESLIRRMQPLEDSRLYGKIGGQKSAELRKQIKQIQPPLEAPSTPPASTLQPSEKIREEENRVDKSIGGTQKQVFTKPSQGDIVNYLTNDKNYDFFTAQGFADRFLNHYDSNGWKVGKNSMRDWRASVRTWISKENEYKSNNHATSKRVDTARPGTILSPL